jgi:hypothetical protein
MKKVIFALAAVVALAACSKEQTVSFDKGAAIGFDTFVENSTRSVNNPSFVMNGNMFEEFGVFGAVENSALFSGQRVYKSGGNWIYDDPQYWIVGAKYNFAAVAPYGAYTNANYTSVSYEGTTTLSFVNGYVESDKVPTNGTVDLLYAATPSPIEGKAASRNPAEPNNGKVEFNFRHVLSKVKFSFKNDYNASMATIKVYNVKIHNAYASASATLTNDATVWNNQQGAIVLDFGNASDFEETSDKESAEVAYGYNKTYESLNERLLIPGVATPLTGDANTGYKVTFDVDLLVNGTKIRTYSHTAYANFEPKAGNTYDIITSINATNIDPDNAQEAIQFTVTSIGEWDTDYNDGENGDNNITM